MIHLVLGPAFSGKTTFLYRLTQTLCRQRMRVFFFVPEQQTAAVEADLFRLCGNTANEVLEVLNFQRLPNRVFRELGGLSAQNYGRTQRALVLAQVLQNYRDRLPLLSVGAEDADYLSSLLSFLETLSRSQITPAVLEQLSEDPRLSRESQLCKKLSETALLLSAFEEAGTRACGGRTPDDQRRLIELLDARQGAGFFEDATILIDGFYDFTAPEYELIRRMGRMAKDLYISFLSQKGQEELFFRSERARQTLCDLPGDPEMETILAADSLPERKEKAPDDLVFLCDHVLNAPESPYPKAPEHIRVTRAKTPLEEVRGALCEILLAHANEGVEFSDCAVLYRNGGLYDALLREEAQRFGIPLYTGERKTLLSSPLSLFFRCAAQIAAGDTRAQTLINLLQTGLVPLQPSEAGLLQRYIRTWDLSGASLYKNAPYTASPRAYQNLVTQAMKDAAAAELNAVNAAKERLFSLLERLKQCFSAPDFSSKVAALKSFAENCGVPDRLSQKIADLRKAGRFSDAAAEEGLFGACQSALSALEDLDGEIKAGEFSVYLRLAFSFLSVGKLPSSPNALAAGEISFARLKKVKRLYLLGVNSSIFPSPDTATGVFDKREQELCASLDAQFDLIGDRGPVEEYFYFYLAASTPTERLTLSYHTHSLSGEKETKSVFIDRLAFLFPKLFEDDKGKSREPEPKAQNNLPVNESMLYAYLCAHRESGDPFTLAMRRYAEDKRLFDLPMTEAQIASLRDTRPPIEPKKELVLSQSKLETFARCPYRYFLKYDLFLSPDPLAQVDASMLGELTHYVAEYGYKCLIREKTHPQQLDRDALAKLVRDASDAYFAEKLPEGVAESSRFFAQTDRMERANLRLLENLFTDTAQSAYQPFLFEAGLGHELPPYYLRLPDGTNAVFSGKVDRVDLALTPTGNYACVIDYKTGTHNKIELSDVYNGLETQLFVYLCALRNGGVLLQNKRLPVTPAAAVYLAAYSGIPMAESAKKAEVIIENKLARRGLYLSDENALSAFGTAARHGFSYQKNGPHALSGSFLINQKNLDRLLDSVEDRFRQTALAIKSGKIERKPLKRHNNAIGCDFCDYRSICRMDSGGACRPYRYHEFEFATENTQKTEVTDDE